MLYAITGAVIVLISVSGGLLLGGRNAPDLQRPEKVMRFVLYFWMLTFLQLIVVAIGYSILNR